MNTKNIVVAAALALSPCAVAQSQQAAAPQAMGEFGIAQTPKGWEYRVVKKNGESERLLTADEQRRVRDFFEKLPTGEDRDAALCAPLLKKLQEQGQSPEGHPWFEQTPSGLALSDRGKEVLVAAILAADQPLPDAPAPADRMAKAGRRLAAVAVAPQGWEPRALPVDEANGGGGWGYAVAGQDAHVTPVGQNEYWIHEVAANYLNVLSKGRGSYKENPELTTNQRFETHTSAVGVSRGFKIDQLPRFDVSAQMQVDESNPGFMNQFIAWFEGLATGKSNYQRKMHRPLANTVAFDGKTLYNGEVHGWGLGDTSVTAKFALKDADPTSKALRVAAYTTANIAGQEQFTNGNFVGVGVGADKKVTNRLAFHLNGRETFPLDGEGKIKFPLRRTSFGGYGGAEILASKKTSVNFQLEGNTSPYQRTGTRSFDDMDGAIAGGVTHSFVTANRVTKVQFYGVENSPLPAMNFNNDYARADFTFGLKVTTNRRSDERQPTSSLSPSSK